MTPDEIKQIKEEVSSLFAAENDERFDIRQTKLIQKILKEECLSILDSVPLPILVMDLEFNIVKQNKEAFNLYGHEVKNISDLNSAYEGGSAKDERKKLLKEGHWDGILFQEFNGRRLIVKTTISVDKDLIFSCNRDITHSSKMKKDLETLVSTLNEELEVIAYAIGHDFQQPLRTIRNMADMMILDHPEMGDLEVIIKAANWLNKLITSLLNYRRLSIDRPVEVDVGEILELVLNNLKTQIREHEADISIVNPPLPQLFIDERHIYSLFQNLIENAIKYRRQYTTPIIKIGYEKIEGFYKFFVEDNGRGIPDENKEKVFDIFRRFVSDENGTGMGLSECRKIIESKEGGKIWVESNAQKGCTFYFTIPYDENSTSRR